MSWATLADVEAITGATVDVAQLAQAQSVIDIYANRGDDLDTDSIRPRDQRSLKQAVAWQAAWIAGQAGYETRSAFRELDQDGLRVRAASASEVMLAPLAARVLKNLSWKGSRTVHMSSRTRPLAHPDLIDYTDDSSDVRQSWTPL